MLRSATKNEIDSLARFDKKASRTKTSLKALRNYWMGVFIMSDILLETDTCGSIRGVVYSSEKSESEREIARVFTDPNNRHQGIASRLLQESLKQAAEAGQKTLLSVHYQNDNAIRLYQAFGFVAQGKENALGMLEMSREP